MLHKVLRHLGCSKYSVGHRQHKNDGNAAEQHLHGQQHNNSTNERVSNNSNRNGNGSYNKNDANNGKHQHSSSNSLNNQAEQPTQQPTQQQPQQQGAAGAAASPTVWEVAQQQLKLRLEGLLKNDHEVLAQEYGSLQDIDVMETSDAAEHCSNAPKNRYVNVLPFDFNRVKISGEDDYINASVVQSDDGDTPMWVYIAAQGPLASTTADFWKMIFESNTRIIVMLTRTIENNHIKCAQYYCPHAGETSNHGPYRVTTTEVRAITSDICLRTLLLKNQKTQETRQIKHYQYHRWPDHGVPESTAGIRQLIHALADSQWGTRQATPVVHCSAGIGRTGTLAAIDIILKQLQALAAAGGPVDEAAVSEALDLPAVVQNLRRQRRGMVQTLEQYSFCYEAVLDEVSDIVQKAQQQQQQQHNQT